MHAFRRRWEDLSPEKQQALEELFEKVPTLGAIYHHRWEATRIFDTAADRKQAEEGLKAWIQEVRQTDLDWEPFINMLHNHWDGILAYFQERKSSGPVEGLNTKVRVILRRGYGIPTLTTLWQRLLLDVNWAWKKVGADDRPSPRSGDPHSGPICPMLHLKTGEPGNLWSFLLHSLALGPRTVVTQSGCRFIL